MARLGWFIVLLAGSITAGAQSGDRAPVAAPKQEIAGEAQATRRELPRIGDTWTYRLTERTRDGKPRLQSSYVVKVTASSSTSIRDEVSSHGGRGIESTHSPGGHMVEQVVSVFSPYLVVFEDLKPGDRIWRVTEHDDWCFIWVHCSTVGRVEGRETVELAAGSFDTIKVSIEQTTSSRQAPPTMPGGGSRLLTIWYSPQAKRAVKVTSRASGGSARTTFHASFDLELLSYQLDRTPVVAPKGAVSSETRPGLVIGSKPDVQAAQTSAAKVLPRVGDTWTYRLAEQPHEVYQRWDNSYVVKIKASSSTSIVDEVSRDGARTTEWTHSPGRHMVEQVVSVFSPYLVVFENLNPGDRIWHATQHDDSCFTWLTCWTMGRVEGRETLTLPAGTFDTIKVTLEQNVQRRLIGTGHGGPITTRTLTIWYSPQAKRAVKVTSRKSLGLRTPFFASFDLELVSYQLQ